MLQVDLHLHTQASDGTWTPEELVAKAKAKGLGLIAITDHENVGSVLAGERAAQKAGLQFLRGVEVSASDQASGGYFHILGYGINPNSLALLQLLDHNEKLLLQKDEDSIELLQAQGWPVSLPEYYAYEFNRRDGGFKALNYLIAKGLCKDVRDFFIRIFTTDMGLGFPQFPDVEEVISTIHGAGGLAFLAHSASAFHGPGLDTVLRRLQGKNFDGFECYHTSHNQEDTAALVRYCHERHKLISGGSDCHGNFTSRVMGIPQIYLEDINLGGLI